MNKKLIRLMVALSVLVLPALVQAQFFYTINNGAVTITGYSGNGPLDVVIPATLSGHPVTTIGQYAFVGYNITSVTIPNSVTSVEDYAFYYCTSLTSVTLPNSFISIGNSVTNIGVAAFANCTRLASIIVDASNPAYSSGGGVLFDKANATLLQFPGGLGGSYRIPNSVTSIGQDAFEGSHITTVTIPNSVTNIGQDAFANGTILTNINVDAANPAYSSMNGVLFDKAQATLLQFPGGLGGGYTIPNSVTSIGGGNSFSVTSIGDYAFESCSSLTSVTIPNSVTSIGYDAFAETLLTTAYFWGNAPPDDGTIFSGDPATVYYLAGTTGWGSYFGGVPAVLWNPQASAFGFTGGKFRFNLTGPTNAVIVIEACTNLSHPVWLPVSTNTLSGLGTSAFSDPTGYPMRYYRFRSP